MRSTRGRAQARQAHVPNLVIQSELRIRPIQRLFTEPVIHVYWEKMFLPSIHKEKFPNSLRLIKNEQKLKQGRITTHINPIKTTLSF